MNTTQTFAAFAFVGDIAKHLLGKATTKKALYEKLVGQSNPESYDYIEITDVVIFGQGGYNIYDYKFNTLEEALEWLQL